ncbi:hypothetical protein NHP21005_11310 [Helicobacter sp. NHP21005]|uniref:restriction endonuclease subunit S n=1 Tax=Helicobacter felistomachi TaxID=3040201 RepID=UPI0025729375|nr:restriction endonuclease subunit S [Helicobacter sp. NHP21005]BEG57443.1 hypothetical protein NHP21005_11310 [Helicobacter sp. NHP21005]
MYARLTNTPSPDLSPYRDPDPEGYQLFSTPLSGLIDFSKSVLDKAISLNPKQDDLAPASGWELVSLSDPQKFSLSIGKRILNSELNPQGKIPVYSANVSKPFGYSNQELLEDYNSDCVLWGIDGDWMTAYMPKDTPFYPTDHCGVLRPLDPNIKAKVLRYALYQAGQKKGFCRNLRASLQRVRDIKIPLPPLEVQEQIIATCAQVEKRAKEVQEGIRNYQNLILAVLGVCGVVQDKAPQIATILETLERLNLELTNPTTTEPKLEELKSLVQNLPSPPAGGWEMVRLSNPEQFYLSIGKRVLDSELNPQGTIPVYSANVSKPFGYTNQELLEDYNSDCVLWGIDGDWITAYMPKDTPFTRPTTAESYAPLMPTLKPQSYATPCTKSGKNKAFAAIYGLHSKG